jgi:hypothetical protein
MAINKYYSNLYEMEDPYRRNKYLSLLLSSLQNDLSKWTENINTRIKYFSPNYGDSSFVIEIMNQTTIAYVMHKTPPKPDHTSELISDSFGKELSVAVQKLRESIYTPEIYELEKFIGNQHSRKEKLDALDLEQHKEIIDDTYNDWLSSQNEITARMIAKIIYSYRKNEEKYNLWLEKFNEYELIMSELNKIKG